MTQVQECIRLHTTEKSGPALTIMGRRITPIIRETAGQVLGFQLQACRPVGVEIARTNTIQRLVIPQATRRGIGIATLAGLSVAALGFGLAVRRATRKERHNDHHAG